MNVRIQIPIHVKRFAQTYLGVTIVLVQKDTPVMAERMAVVVLHQIRTQSSHGSSFLLVSFYQGCLMGGWVKNENIQTGSIEIELGLDLSNFTLPSNGLG